MIKSLIGAAFRKWKSRGYKRQIKQDNHSYAEYISNLSPLTSNDYKMIKEVIKILKNSNKLVIDNLEPDNLKQKKEFEKFIAYFVKELDPSKRTVEDIITGLTSKYSDGSTELHFALGTAREFEEKTEKAYRNLITEISKKALTPTK